MNTRSTSLLFAALVIGITRVAAAVPLDSSAFNHQYNGNVYPVPNYTENPPFASGPSTDGNDLTFRAPTGAGYFSSNDWSVVHATGFTVEFRLKIDDDFAEGSKGVFALYFGDATAGDVLSVGKSSMWVGVGALQVDSSTNIDGYHTFRVAQAGGTPTPINFYRDGVLIHTWPNGGNFASNVLFAGSGGGAFGGPTVHLDYLRWDNTGAYEPVPEPAAAGLLIIGALGLIRIARRT